MTTFTGTSGNDVLSGTGGGDTFSLGQGGEDGASGLGGNDVFSLLGAFDAGDTIDGGDGQDQLWLRGDYAAGVTFTATTLVNVERFALGAGFDYTLTTADSTVAAGATLTMDASKLGGANAVDFDGSAEHDGSFRFIAGGLTFTAQGGVGNDRFDDQAAQSVIERGHAGNDVFNLGANLIPADRIDGGAGNDTVNLDGDYTQASNDFFADHTLTRIETLNLAGGHSYIFSPTDTLVAASATLTVNGHAMAKTDSLTWHGNDSNGSYDLIGSPGSDVLVGGAANDLIRGGISPDVLTGGGGADVFEYMVHSESKAKSLDHITDFAPAMDKFLMPITVGNVEAVTAPLDDLRGSLATAVDSGLAAHGAAVVTADGGALAGHVYLVVDLNGTAGYELDDDFVIDITPTAAITETLTTANFTTV